MSEILKIYTENSLVTNYDCFELCYINKTLSTANFLRHEMYRVPKGVKSIDDVKDIANASHELTMGDTGH